MRSLLLLVVALVAAGALADIGVKTTVSQTGINYGVAVGQELALQLLGSLTIPDISADVDTPIGHITIDVSSIVLSNIAMPDTTATLDASINGIDLNVQQLSGDVSFNWDYREDAWPHVSDHGSGTATVSPSSVSGQLQMSMANARLAVSCTSLTVSISDVDIHLSGGASWLYDIFINAFHSQIVSAIQSALQSGLTNAVDTTLENALAGAPVVAPLGSNSNLQIDFSLEENPEVTSSYLDLAVKGLIEYTPAPAACSCTSVDMPSNPEPSLMATVSISACVANCGFEAVNQTGRLLYVIEPNQVPASSPVQLNTKNVMLSSAMPGLKTFCPGCNITMVVQATEPPFLEFATTGTTVFVPGIVTLLPVFPNGTAITAVVFNANATLSATVAITGGRNVVLQIEQPTAMSLTVLHSYIGTVQAAGLDGLLKLLLAFGTPVINEKLAPGFPLPAVDGVTFVDSTVSIQTGYATVATNVTYKKP